MGYSRGVSYTLGYALTNLSSIKGLVLGDYPAYHSKLPSDWVEFFSALPPWRGKTLSERMKSHALCGIQKESKQVIFWNQLHLITCPVLVVRGGKQGSALSEEDSGKYMKNLPHCHLIVFEESDHNIFEPRIEKFVDVVREFFGFIK